MERLRLPHDLRDLQVVSTVKAAELVALRTYGPRPVALGRIVDGQFQNAPKLSEAPQAQIDKLDRFWRIGFYAGCIYGPIRAQMGVRAVYDEERRELTLFSDNKGKIASTTKPAYQWNDETVLAEIARQAGIHEYELKRKSIDERIAEQEKWHQRFGRR